MRKWNRNKNSVLELFKPGILFVVLLTGLVGYGLSFRVENQFQLVHLIGFLMGLTLLSAGSFALNQAQEHQIDRAMPRTQNRPIPADRVSPKTAYWLGFLLVLLGAAVLWFVRPLASVLGVATAVMYNLFYTLFWKRKWSFGAVPGAIPGAMPVVIGYAAHSDAIYSPECLYMFFVMFLWQMPHFWALAIRFREDYRSGGIPVLPVVVGVDRTLFHIGLYVFVYVGLAFASPWFVETGYLYFLLVVPFALKVFWEFVKYNKARGEKHWLPFFLWVNTSLLVFLVVPVVEKWMPYVMSR